MQNGAEKYRLRAPSAEGFVSDKDRRCEIWEPERKHTRASGVPPSEKYSNTAHKHVRLLGVLPPSLIFRHGSCAYALA